MHLSIDDRPDARGSRAFASIAFPFEQHAARMRTPVLRNFTLLRQIIAYNSRTGTGAQDLYMVCMCLLINWVPF